MKKKWRDFLIVVAQLGNAKVNILYQHLRQITDAEFVDLLKRSTLAERRPIDDPNCIIRACLHEKTQNESVALSEKKMG